MTIVFDTGPLIAYVHKEDPYHERALALVARALRGEWGLPIILDHVVDEGITFLRKRASNRAITDAFLNLVLGDKTAPIGELAATSLEDLRDAIRLHLKYFDRKLSLTDCAIALRAAQVRGVVATFDKRFEGIVPVVTA